MGIALSIVSIAMGTLFRWVQSHHLWPGGTERYGKIFSIQIVKHRWRKNMTKNRELRAAFILWEKLCELERLLFDHYGNEFFELHLEDHTDTPKPDKERDWPFWSYFIILNVKQNLYHIIVITFTELLS